MSAQRMCPSEACEHHGEPTNEQLARLIAVFSSTTPDLEPVSVAVAQGILDRLPAVRAEWLERHREVQAVVGSQS